MRRRHVRRFFSYVTISCGAVLFFLGARDFLESRSGQSEAARRFEQEITSPGPRPSAGSEPSVPPAESPILDAPVQPHSFISPGDTLAKLIIPRLDSELYVVEGDGAKELRRGPGHLTGTAMPGSAGNCVIAGHRDTHFRVLKDIRKGDDIILQTRQGTFLYRVREMSIVSPNNTRALRPTSDAELNLITCYPFYYLGSAPKRFVVEAQLAGKVSRAS